MTETPTKKTTVTSFPGDIKLCKGNCTNSYQDTKYGKGNRVMNTKKAGGMKCTVCGTVN